MRDVIVAEHQLAERKRQAAATLEKVIEKCHENRDGDTLAKQIDEALRVGVHKKAKCIRQGKKLLEEINRAARFRSQFSNS